MSLDVKQALAFKFTPLSITLTEKDVILYALGIGEGFSPSSNDNLKFTYEHHPEFSTIPSLGVIFCLPFISQVHEVPGLSFDPMMLLHGEHYLEIFSTIPTSGTFVTNAKITNIFDKGKGALIVVEAITQDKSTGKDICLNRASLFVRGLGNFGGDRGPQISDVEIPKKPQDVVHIEKTSEQQALLYRWGGFDLNPLHADPSMASLGGFSQPILHGLCSLGFATRAILHNVCYSDPSLIKSIKVRFTKHVFPGDTITTEIWKVSPKKAAFQCKVHGRDGFVLSNAVVDFVKDPHFPAAKL